MTRRRWAIAAVLASIALLGLYLAGALSAGWIRPGWQRGRWTPRAIQTSGGLRRAAGRLLARGIAVNGWQTDFLEAIAEGREATIPAGRGVGRAWLIANLADELEAGDA